MDGGHIDARYLTGLFLDGGNNGSSLWDIVRSSYLRREGGEREEADK